MMCGVRMYTYISSAKRIFFSAASYNEAAIGMFLNQRSSERRSGQTGVESRHSRLLPIENEASLHPHFKSFRHPSCIAGSNRRNTSWIDLTGAKLG